MITFPLPRWLNRRLLNIQYPIPQQWTVHNLRSQASKKQLEIEFPFELRNGAVPLPNRTIEELVETLEMFEEEISYLDSSAAPPQEVLDRWMALRNKRVYWQRTF